MRRTWAIKASDLTVDQKNAIEKAPLFNYSIFGPPGSGKTNVLLLRAKYLATLFPTKKILCLVFTSALKQFIRNGIVEYNLEPTFVHTFHGWGINCLKDIGVEVDDFDEVAPKIKFFLNKGDIPKFDFLLVDEAQDFDRETLSLFFELAEYVNFFFDKNQSIYQSHNKTDNIFPKNLSYFVNNFNEIIELPTNFRVPFKIAQLASSILPGTTLDKISVKDDRGDFPIYKTFANSHDELSFIKSRIDDLPNENPDFNFVILEKTNKENLEKTYEDFKNIGLLTETIIYGYPKCDFSNTKPKLMTLHSVKGLEFDIVFVIKSTPLCFPGYINDRNLAYVAVTRAKYRVFITAERSISEVFCPPPRENTEKKITLEDLFL